LAKNPEGMQDIGNILREAWQDVLESSDKLNKNFVESKNNLLDLDKLFDQLVKTSDDLPSNLSKGNDLQKAILKDSNLFLKTQKESLKLFDKINKDGWKEMVRYLEEVTGKQGKSLKQTKEYKEALKDRKVFEKENLAALQEYFALKQKEAEILKLEALKLQNIAEIVDDLGAKIRNPSQAFTALLHSAGSLPSKLLESSKGSKHLGETLTKLVAPALEKMVGFGKILFSPTGLLILGVGLAAAAATTLYKLFANFWEFLDKKVMPAVADFNKQIGGAGQAVDNLRSMSVSAGVQFEMLGMSFQEGAAAVRDFASGLQSTDDATKKSVDIGKKLIAVYGISGEESGRLAMQFQKQTGSLDGLTDMVMSATREAEKYGVPVNDVVRDLAKFPNILARFGTANRTEFAKAAAKARSYGLDIGKVNEAFGEQLDTFEGSSDAAAKLNAMFGTTINSYELMMETDPTKRMEMLRKSLLGQGKEWNKLSKFEQNVITSTMGVDKETAQLILSSDKERKKLEATAKQREEQVKLNQKWDNSLGKVKRTLLNWEAVLGKVMRSVAAFAGKLLFNIDISKDTAKFAGQVEKALMSLSTWFDNLTKSIGDEGFTGILGDLSSMLKGDNNVFGNFTDTIKDMRGAFSALKTALSPIVWLIEQIQNMPDAIQFFGALITGDMATMSQIAKKQGMLSVTPVKAPTLYTKTSFGDKSKNSDAMDFSQPDMKKAAENINVNVYLDGRQVGSALSERAHR
jgi:hypothetical protein